MTWKRAQRLEALIKEKVATVIVEHLADPALGFVTVLRCELSDDKRTARVFYSVLGEPTAQRRTIRAIERAAPHVQERIAPSLRIRYMPKLVFIVDQTLEKEAHLHKLIDEVAKEWREDEPPVDEAEAEVATGADDEAIPTPRSGHGAADDDVDDEPFDDDDLDG